VLREAYRERRLQASLQVGDGIPVLYNAVHSVCFVHYREKFLVCTKRPGEKGREKGG
jgi:hypothetical protein